MTGTNIASSAIALHHYNLSNLASDSVELEKARDGLVSTQWLEYTYDIGYTANNVRDVGAALGYEFASPKTVTKIRFFNHRHNALVADFRIERDNGGTWTKVPIIGSAELATIINGDEAQAANQIGWVTVTFAPVTSTKFRIFITDVWNYNSDVNASISEIEIYGGNSDYVAAGTYPGTPTVFDSAADNSGHNTYSEGDRLVTKLTSTGYAALSTYGMTGGHSYAELTLVDNPNNSIAVYPGVFKSTVNKSVNPELDAVGTLLVIRGDGRVFWQQTGIAEIGDISTPGTVLGIEISYGNFIKFYVDGVLKDSYSPAGLWSDSPALHIGFTTAGSDVQGVQYRIDGGQDLEYYPVGSGAIRGFGPGEISKAGYYVTTGDANHLSLANIHKINSCGITYSEPTNTILRALVSFDGRQSWNKWNGTSWEPHVGGLTDLVNGNAISELAAGLSGFVVGDESFLDFAFYLETSDNHSTPALDLITVNYDEEGTYKRGSGSDYEVEYLSSTQTKITKLSAGVDENIKVNILL